MVSLNRLRVLTVVATLGLGGTERAAETFARQYKQLGADSRVWAINDGGPRRARLAEDRIPVYCGTEIWTNTASWAPDVIHVHTNGVGPEDVLMLTSQFPSARVVEQNVFSRPTPWSSLLHASFQLESECMDRYLKFGGSAPAHIVPNPIEISSFFHDPQAARAFRRSLGIPDTTVLLGRVGQPSCYKWSPLLLHTLQDIVSKGVDAHLVVVGAPRQLLSDINRSGLQSRITAITKIEGDSSLRAAYSAIDIFVHVASQGESFGYVLTEALLCESPVVTMATPWADNSQVNVVGNSNMIAYDRQDMFKTTFTLATNPELRKNIGQEGRKHVVGKYEASAVAALALEIAQAEPTKSSLSGSTRLETWFALLRLRVDPKVRFGAWRWIPSKALQRVMRFDSDASWRDRPGGMTPIFRSSVDGSPDRRLGWRKDEHHDHSSKEVP